MSKFDLAVIGAGPGGLEAALRAQEAGLKTALIEKKDPGGTCLNTGCIPTKALLATARLAARIRRAGEFGFEKLEPRADWARLLERKNKLVSDLRAAALAAIRKSGVEWVEGAARFAGPRELEVTGKTSRTIEAENILIAAGSEPAPLPGFEFDGKRILSSTDALELKKLPESLLIVGGGAVGVEFATIFHAMGVPTTVMEMMDRLLPAEDIDCAKRLEHFFMQRGIRVLTGTRLVPDAREVREAAAILVAAGRRAHSRSLSLEKVSIEPAKNGTIPVNEFLETRVPGIFAIGDVIDSPQLAHAAAYEGVLVVENLARKSKRPVDYRAMPSCVYSDPEVAGIGKVKKGPELAEDLAEVRIPFAAVGKAQVEGEAEGFFKLTAEIRGGKIVGASGIGARVTELLPEISLALRHGLTVFDLLANVHAHPTESEIVSLAARELARRIRK